MRKNIPPPGRETNALADHDLFSTIAGKFRSGNFAGARDNCEHHLAAVADSTRHAQAYFWLAAIEAHDGLQARAAAQFERALALEGHHPFWLLQAGLTHFKLGNLARAEALYRDALQRQPVFAIAHYNLGVLLQQNADLPGARQAFEAAIHDQPRFAEAHNNLANTLVAMKDHDGAETHYRLALRDNPQLANAHYGLGLHYARRLQGEAACRCLEAAVRDDPAHWEAWLALAECHHLAGHDDIAVDCVRQVLAHDPSNAVAQFKQAQFGGLQPAQIPPQIIDRLYADMADTFDEHLQQRLGYCIPALLVDALTPWLDRFAQSHKRLPHALDLGCGTGLFGVAVRDDVGRLVGVDLSPAMLAKARQRSLYDELIAGDLQDFLRADLPPQREPFDLVAACDVLIYLGNIDHLLMLVASRLNGGGRFVFSIESPQGMAGDFRLQPSGRYAHGTDYIARLAHAAGFEVIRQFATVVRTESAIPLDGFAYILQKPQRR